MYDEALREIAGAYARLSRADEVFAAAEAAAPARSTGSDRTGTVHAVVGRDGIPESFVVDPGWHRALGATGLAGAVAEACAAAGTAAWEASAPSGADPREWFTRLHRAFTEDAPAPRPAPAHRQPRPLDAVVADALDHLGPILAGLGGTGSATGTAAGGRLSLTLDPAGSVSCEADPDWVSRQEAGELGEALDRALAAARAGLSAGADGMARAEAVFGELFERIPRQRREGAR
ncbi:hypothetical protein [Phytohabitans suffuscus]|uniref:Uncharacterized protein n=1 Tax=Phytohabitans suffuscus TaxID=624315 RepID=A0A6F8YQF9_9ACTN|nr:hypothetical protein [Phytohabitans suffuscus]BCB88314.1 hypothetical protein Psuf_056270 [Phytohabitans suffuscus]